MTHLIPFLCMFASTFLRGVQHHMLTVKSIPKAMAVSSSICLFDGSVIYLIAQSQNPTVILTNSLAAACGIGAALFITRNLGD